MMGCDIAVSSHIFVALFAHVASEVHVHNPGTDISEKVAGVAIGILRIFGGAVISQQRQSVYSGEIPGPSTLTIMHNNTAATS